MAMKFKVTQYIKDYVIVDDTYTSVEAEVEYESHNYDELQNFLLTLIENSVKPVKIEIEKEEVCE